VSVESYIYVFVFVCFVFTLINKIERFDFKSFKYNSRFLSTYNMSKPLIIVESPAKCAKIEEYLGGEYQCLASYGHIRELVDVDISNNFKPKFKMIEGKNLSKLKKAIETASEVILATDDDREGEAIAWHLAQVYKLPVKSTKRIIFHEITPSGLLTAVSSPKTIDMNKVNSQMARMVLDRVVGYNVSPILWKYISKTAENSLSAGRCQTPALRLIYDNQRDIDDNGPGTETYDVVGYFTKLNIPFKLDSDHNLTKETMEEFLENTASHEHVITRKEPTRSERKAPQPFITSTLQQSASNVLHFSPKDTMRLAQTLYENGYITYMRTDSKKYSETFIASAVKYLKQNYSEDVVATQEDLAAITLGAKPETNTIQSKKKATPAKTDITQDAHEAIRPTNIATRDIVDEKIGQKERRLYALIWANSLQSCMASAIYSVIRAEIASPIPKVSYFHTAELPVRLGWQTIGKSAHVADTEEDEPANTATIYNYYTTFTTIPMNYNKITAKFAVKQSKQHYTEAKLVNLLETRNIGRPATFSSLIDKIQEREYVSIQTIDGKQYKCVDYELSDDEIKEITTLRSFGKENKKLVIQPIGTIVIEFLTKHFNDLFVYEYTGNMENELDAIAKGEMEWQSLCQRCYDQIKQLTDKIADEPINKNKLDDNHSLYVGKYGPCIKFSAPDKQTKYYKIKKDVSINDLLEKKIAVKDAIVDEDRPDTIDGYLGEHNGEKIIVKDGKFGPYVQFNGKSYSIKGIAGEPSIEDIVSLIQQKDASTASASPSSNILRQLSTTPELSLRKGQYGPYFYYKTIKMKQPKFYPTKSCPFDSTSAPIEKILQWFKEAHGIVLE
jgi:DNA topoisomerase-1